MIYRKHSQSIDVFTMRKAASTLSAVNFGWEKTEEDFQEISNVRDYTLLHFVTNGEGTLIVKGQQYALQADTVFLICPGIMVTYGNCRGKAPLEFAWVGFSNSELMNLLFATGLDANHPVATCSCCAIVHQMIRQETDHVLANDQVNIIRANALLFNCLACMSETHTHKSAEKILPNSIDDQMQAMLSFIKSNYNMNLSIHQLCQDFHISHSSMWRFFQIQLGMSPNQYIRSLRIQMACVFLREGMRVKDVAMAVGWHDQYFFSKIFKQEKGISPREYGHMAFNRNTE